MHGRTNACRPPVQTTRERGTTEDDVKQLQSATAARGFTRGEDGGIKVTGPRLVEESVEELALHAEARERM